MDYSSVQAIFDAGITNMTVVTTSVTVPFGISNFYFKGTKLASAALLSTGLITYNGNSTSKKLIGYDYLNGSHKIQATYSETGTLNTNIDFFKLRWAGFYGTSSYTNQSIIWDVVFFSNGSICFHVANLGATVRARSTAPWVSLYNSDVMRVGVDNPYVTWYAQDTTGTNFEVVNEIANFDPAVTKYLFKSGDTYYTASDNTLTELTDVSELTASIFQNDGCTSDDFTNDTLAELFDNSFAIYKWGNKEVPTLSATLNAVPTVQSVLVPITIPEEATDILSVTAEYSGSPLWIVSLDGETWKYFDTTNDAWIETESNIGVNDISTLTETLTSSNWSDLLEDSSKFYFKFSLATSDDKVTNIIFKWAQ